MSGLLPNPVLDWPELYTRLATDPNDPLAWSALQRAVRPWARAAVGAARAHQVDDMVAETCASVVLSLDRARSPHTFSGFAYGCFLNQRRRHRRGPQVVPLEEIDLPAPELPEPWHRYADQLATAMARLPDRERRAVLLRYIDDEPPAAIATRLGVSPVNARQIVHKGLRRLRQVLDVDRLLSCAAGMALGTPSISTADLTPAGRKALSEACSVVTHRCIEDLADAGHPWLAAVLDCDPQDELLARRFLACLVAVGQKLMDPRPLQPSSLAEVLAASVIWHTAEPSLAATESAVVLPALARAIRCQLACLEDIRHLTEPDLSEWFEPDTEINPAHPYVLLTEDEAREIDVLIDEV